MQSDIEKISDLERRMTLIININDVEKEVQLQLNSLAKTAKTPGFRPGKVPINILSNIHGVSIRHDVVTNMVNDSLKKRIDSAGLKIAGIPIINPLDSNNDNSLFFDVKFFIYPDIELPDFSTISINHYICNITDKEIDKTIEILRQQHATYLPIDNRSIRDGDKITVDFIGTIDGNIFNGGKSENFPFIVGNKQMLEEFNSNVIGMILGETKKFNLNFPKNYHDSSLSGKEAEFTVNIKSIEEPILPNIDDKFITSLGFKNGNIDDFKKSIRNSIERESNLQLAQKNKNAVIDSLIDNIKFPLPKPLVDKEIDICVSLSKEEMKKQNKNFAIPREAFFNDANRRVQTGLILSKIVNEFDISIKIEDIKAYINNLSKNYSSDDRNKFMNQYLSNENLISNTRSILLEEKAINYVLEKSIVIDKIIEFEDLMRI